jgi:MFS family permease
MGSINALPNYLKYYDVPENDQSGTGIVFAIFQVGQMTGALFVWLADWKGRKLPVFLGCAGVIVGTIVTATAKTCECSSNGIRAHAYEGSGDVHWRSISVVLLLYVGDNSCANVHRGDSTAFGARWPQRTSGAAADFCSTVVPCLDFTIPCGIWAQSSRHLVCL